jgi:hypothetical protein
VGIAAGATGAGHWMDWEQVHTLKQIKRKCKGATCVR